MSFVVDVLNTAGENEIKELTGKINAIEKEMEKMKRDIEDFVRENYIEFTTMLKKDDFLATQTEKLLIEMKELRARTDEQIKIKIPGSTKELNTFSNSLKELNLSLSISNRILEIHSCCSLVKRFLHNEQYLKAAEYLHKMKSTLFESPTELASLEIDGPLKLEYSKLHEELSVRISSLWQKCVCLKVDDNAQNTFVISIDEEDNRIPDLIAGMHHVDNLDKCLEEFSLKLQQHFIRPIIFYKHSLRIENKSCLIETLDKMCLPEYKCTLHNLKLLFIFLHQHLGTVIEKLRRYLIEEFSSKLIGNCISRTIPNSSLELKGFAPIKDDIIEFENYLVSIDFISSKERFLSAYTKNVDNLYMKKMCQDYLARAKDIMKKDLHDSMKHVIQEPLEFPEDMIENYDYDLTNRQLSSATFQLPPCQISKSAKEVLDLAKEILNEACRNSDNCALKLFHTSRDVFEMYASLVPLHHKQFLETIPQQVALFHNNCMYLAHYLLTLAYEHEYKLPDIAQQHNLTYVDQVLLLRSIGTEQFLNQMKYQRNIILDILRESGLSNIGQCRELPENTEKALRQCIRQLELLKTVWLGILPENIYCRALGCIMNSMLEDLIAKVMNVEDIQANVATDLVTLFNLVVRRAPAIFPNPEMIQLHVRKWKKLQELMVVLGASLKDIEGRWADGKGPLAHEFSADHVRQLVKALFQNTDRRSAILSKIK